MGSKATSTKNASRQYKGLVRKFGFSLPIQISKHEFQENGARVDMPYIRPRDLLVCLMSLYPWLFLGGLLPGPEASALLLAFWLEYKKFQPGHPVFACDNGRLSKTLPICLHGDGGRTQKKSPLEVISLEAVLGLNTAGGQLRFCRCKRPCPCGGGDATLPGYMQLNNKHHSFLSRFLLLAFPSKDYKYTPGLLQSLLAALSVDIGQLCVQGFDVKDSGKWYIACIGMKGDLEYHLKTGWLQRAYTRVGTKNFIQCCHICEAGCLAHPFEDVSPGASWVQTQLQSLPWEHTPPFSAIPFADWSGASNGEAASFFRLDPFHCFRLGVARNFIASSLILLSIKGYFDNENEQESYALEARLARAWAYFMLWCLQQGSKPQGLRSFSKARLHCEKSYQFPHITGKGADTVLILKFFVFFLTLRLGRDQEGGATTRLLRYMLRGAESGLFFTQAIHGHGLFLSSSCANNIRYHLQQFGNSYARLAAACITMRLTLFSMVPKIHSLMHMRTDLTSSGGPVLNVGLWDCSQGEDFIGKISRASRRISNRHIERGIIQCYLVKAKFVIKRFKQKRGL